MQEAGLYPVVRLRTLSIRTLAKPAAARARTSAAFVSAPHISLAAIRLTDRLQRQPDAILTAILNTVR